MSWDTDCTSVVRSVSEKCEHAPDRPAPPAKTAGFRGLDGSTLYSGPGRPSRRESTPFRGLTCGRFTMSLGGERVGEDKVSKRRPFTCRLQLEPAAGGVDCLVQLAQIERQLRQEQVTRREPRIAEHGALIRAELRRAVAPLLIQFAEIELRHVTAGMLLDL